MPVSRGTIVGLIIGGVLFSLTLIPETGFEEAGPGLVANLLLVWVWFGLLTVVHELGHAVAARMLKLRVYAVCLGMGPAAVERHWGETRISVSWIPMGGFVMLGAEEDATHPALRAGLVLGAGTLSHILLLVGAGLLFDGLCTFFVPDWLAHPSPLGTFIWASLVMVLMSMVPYHTATPIGVLPSDGHRIMQLILHPAEGVADFQQAGTACDACEKLRVGDYDGAVERCREGLLLFPESFMLRNTFGVGQIMLGEYEAARNELVVLLDHEDAARPQYHPLLKNNIAYCDVMLDDPELLEEAGRYTEEILRTAPHVPAFEGTRGALLVVQEQYTEAVALLKRVYAQTPERTGRATNACWISVAEQRRGDRDAAIRWFEIARSLEIEVPELRLISVAIKEDAAQVQSSPTAGQRKKSISWLAVLALILACIPVAPVVGSIVGVAALSRLRPDQRGKAAAIVAIPLGLGLFLVEVYVGENALLWLVAHVSKPDATLQVTVAKGFTRVNRFSRRAYFIGKDQHVNVLDTTEPGEPRPVFRIPHNGDLNIQIALAERKDAVIIATQRQMIEVSVKGEARVIWDVDKAGTQWLRAPPKHGHFVWHLSSPPTRKRIFFTLLDAKSGRPREDHVGEFDLEKKRVRLIKLLFPSGIDVAPRAGIVCAPHTGKKVVLKSFDGSVNEVAATQRGYWQCRFSPDETTVLLSSSSLDRDPAMALLDVSSRREEVLPLSCSNAEWLDGEQVLCVCDEGLLLRYRVGKPTAEKLVVVTPALSSLNGRGSYRMNPVVALDRSWVGWGWTAEPRGKLRHGTILIDLKNKEYRLLNGWWHNMQWVVTK